MDPFFSFVYRLLHERGIAVRPQTLRKHKSQGLMSEVYTVSSSEGKLVIHALRPLREHQRQRMWEKVAGVSVALQQYPDIPSAEVLAGEGEGEHHFLVQKMLPGKPAGSRSLKEHAARESWDAEATKIYPQIEKILARLHSARFSHFGWPEVKEGVLRGPHASWRNFFKAEVPLWLESVKAADARVVGVGQALASLRPIERLAQRILRSSLLALKEPSLVHGDAINPSNILVEGDKVSGILDWEWSLLGDRAWEFCDPAWEGVYAHDKLAAYIEQAKAEGTPLEAAALMRRARAYRPLWLLWSCSLHADAPRGLLYSLLRDILESEVSAAFKRARS